MGRRAAKVGRSGRTPGKNKLHEQADVNHNPHAHPGRQEEIEAHMERLIHQAACIRLEAATNGRLTFSENSDIVLK